MSSMSKGVRGGTISGDPLCRTCRNSIRLQGSAVGEIAIFCTEISYMTQKQLPFEAYECPKYEDMRRDSKDKMEQLAWLLRTDPKQKGQLGFVSPKERKKELSDDWESPRVFDDEERTR